MGKRLRILNHGAARFNAVPDGSAGENWEFGGRRKCVARLTASQGDARPANVCAAWGGGRRFLMVVAGFRRMVSLALVAMVALVACTGGSTAPSPAASGSAPAAKSGGQMVVTLLEDPDKLDPSLG